jgi:hypothetical protein
VIREGRVANVALSSELRGAVPEPSGVRGLSIYTTRKVFAQSTDDIHTAAAFAAMVNADLRGPWRMWTASSGPIHIKDPRR